MHIDLTDYSLPLQYTRNGADCSLDPIRKKFIPVTPEEEVRQRMITFLIEHCQVPKQMIEAEVPMCHFEKGASSNLDMEMAIVPILFIEEVK